MNPFIGLAILLGLATVGNIKKMFDESAKPIPVDPTPKPEPTASPTPTPYPLEAGFKKGFEEYGSPLATASGQFAKAAENYPLPDPYTPAVLGLMETGGGKHQRFANNPFNWGMQDMPSLDYTIDRIYSGIGGRMPYYEDYLQSGNIDDLFRPFTPEGPGNPTPTELRQRYEALRMLFPEL